MSDQQLNVAMVGLGTVGGGVLEYTDRLFSMILQLVGTLIFSLVFAKFEQILRITSQSSTSLTKSVKFFQFLQVLTSFKIIFGVRKKMWSPGSLGPSGFQRIRRGYRRRPRGAG